MGIRKAVRKMMEDITGEFDGWERPPGGRPSPFREVKPDDWGPEELSEKLATIERVRRVAPWLGRKAASRVADYCRLDSSASPERIREAIDGILGSATRVVELGKNGRRFLRLTVFERSCEPLLSFRVREEHLSGMRTRSGREDLLADLCSLADDLKDVSGSILAAMEEGSDVNSPKMVFLSTKLRIVRMELDRVFGSFLDGNG
jgi:hypothetical protein